MPIRAVILDLDGTIVDSSSLDALRKARNWRACRANFHKTSCFPDLQTTLRDIAASGIKIGIVTASVSFYAEGLLKHHGVTYDALTAYHDTPQHKPHPAPVLRCLQRLSVQSDEAIGVGDGAEDHGAYNAAGIQSLGAGWSDKLIRDAGWHEILATPANLIKVLKRK